MIKENGMLRLYALLMMTLGFWVVTASYANADERYDPVTDKIVQEECAACHMAFHPQMLPARSWVRMMDNLSNHFGEDASLDQATTAHIKTYMSMNAADVNWLDGKFMRGISDSMTPLRITEVPYWVREHNEEVSAKAWNDPKVKTKSNCLACHKTANRGLFDDD